MNNVLVHTTLFRSGERAAEDYNTATKSGTHDTDISMQQGLYAVTTMATVPGQWDYKGL